MKTKKQIVRVREKELANGNKSLYLDIYWDGKRTKEYLKLYLVKPKTQLDRDNNKQTSDLVEKIRAQKQLELTNSNWGFHNGFRQETNFIEYFKSLIENRKESKGNFGNWDSTLKHLLNYCDTNTTFKDIDVEFVEGFKDYLTYTAKTKTDQPLSSSSVSSYFNKFRACLNEAQKKKIIPYNYAIEVSIPKVIENKREYLTLDELKAIVKAECRYDALKRAFIFSCLTGLRWSDIQKLKWSEVQNMDKGCRIIFHQQKTKGLQYLDISEQAMNYLGEKGNPDDRVFTGLTYSSYMNVELSKWMMRAGITKDITFHCGRHTFAVLQLELGTDIFTVSKLLGHKELRTTQIYAKIMDDKKKEAMNKIPNIGI